MPRLIKDRAIVDDDWTTLADGADWSAIAAERPLIVPLAVWSADRAALQARGRVGVRLAPADDPAALAPDIGTLPLIAIDFPQFTDGRGYSTARLLRERYGFAGELRAVGEVLRDQLYYLHASGFNAFAVRADRDLADALKGLADFSDSYQATVDRPLPLYRRHERPSAAAFAAAPVGVEQ
jgi:uncharacterized protein (DUF934 family)